MSPGSPDASDEFQVIPRRPSAAPPAASPGAGPGSGPPPSNRPAPADAARQRKLTRVVAGTLGMCAFILVAAGIAKAVRPHDPAASPLSSASASAAPLLPPPAASATAVPPPSALAPSPTTGTLYVDRPATPGKVWLDGKKLSAKSVEVSCGKHQIKIGAWGKAHAVSVPCGADLHVTR
jgi:hypothetical protein